MPSSNRKIPCAWIPSTRTSRTEISRLRSNAACRWLALTCCSLASWGTLPCGFAQQPGTVATGNAATGNAAPVDLSIADNADADALEAVVKRAKSMRPSSPQEYQAMQNAIRDASKRLIKLLESDKNSPRFQQAELDAISSSVALMTYFGEDAKKRTVEQVHNFLKARKKLQLQDIQTGMLAAAMIELQANKQPARDTYQLLDDLLKEDEREEMQQLRLTLQASIRRLDLLGNKFELQAKTLDGKEIATEDFAGQYVLVDFLATWCEPCLLEVPRLKNHYAKYYDRGLRILTISIDEDTEALQQFLARAELPWPVIHDNAENPLARLQMKFGVSTLPCILLLNKEGTVVSLEARGAELDRLMQLLFDSPTPAAPPAVSAEPAAAKPGLQ